MDLENKDILPGSPRKARGGMSAQVDLLTWVTQERVTCEGWSTWNIHITQDIAHREKAGIRELSHKRMSFRHYQFNISLLVTCFGCGFIPGVFHQPNAPPAVLLSSSHLSTFSFSANFFWFLFNYKSNLGSSGKSK